MNELFTQQLVRDRQAGLLADAEQRRLAGLRPPKEPLVRFRLTIELQLGRRRLATTDR
jgi:hypothetical protein